MQAIQVHLYRMQHPVMLHHGVLEFIYDHEDVVVLFDYNITGRCINAPGSYIPGVKLA